MELKKMTINGREVEFVNQWRGTRSGFNHETVMFVDGHRWGENTCHYINRTWECYTYQTVMCGVVYDLEERRKYELKEQFKQEKGYAKITGKRKEELEAFYAQDEELKFLEEIYKALRRY